MLRQIIRHEFRNLAADRTLMWVSAVLAVSVAYGVFNGNAWVSFLNGSIRQALQEEQQRIDRARDIVARGAEPDRSTQNPHVARDVGRRVGPRYAYLPPAPLAALAIGQSDLYPVYFLVNTQSKERQKRHSELENPNHLLEGRFDLAFAVVSIFPLLILALSYNLISSEKEQGTLAMVLSQPITLRRFVLVKIVFRAGLICGWLTAFSLLAFAVADVGLLGGQARFPLLLWLGTILAYAAFWFSLAVAVNAWGKGSAANAVTLACLWLLWVVLLPFGINLVVKTAYPMPSRAEFIIASREAAQEAENKKGRILSRYFDDHPEFVAEDSPSDTSEFNTTQYALELEVEKSMKPIEARYSEQLLRQQNHVNRLRFLSPALLAQDALNEIAGTGVGRYRHFVSLADRFHEAWRDFFVPRIFGSAEGARMSLHDYDEMPRYEYVEEPAGRMLRQVWGTLAGLLVAAAVLLAVGLHRLRRYPVAG